MLKGFARTLKFVAALSLAWMLASLPAAAIETIRFEITSLQGEAWQASDVVLDFTWHTPGEASVTIQVGRLQLPAPLDGLTGATLQCPKLAIDGAMMHCPSGELRLNTPMLERADIAAEFTYHQVSGDLQFSLKDVRLAGGHADIMGSFDKAAWRLEVGARDWDVAKLPSALEGFISWPEGYAGMGDLAFSAVVAGQQDRSGELELDGTLTSLSFTDAEGLRAGEKLTADFELSAQGQPEGWRFQNRISAQQGQLYIDPIFLEFSEAVDLSAAGVWHPEQDRLVITELRLDHPELVQVQSRLQLALDPLRLESAVLMASVPRLGPFYETYLQPLVIGTAFDALRGEGSADVALDYGAQGLSSLQISLKDVSLKDERGRYALYGLNGEVTWDQAPEPVQSVLSWEGGQVYELPLGASRARIESRGQDIRLLEAMTLPVLDGKLQIDRLAVGNLGTPELEWRLSGVLTPLSMETFSEAMGWPAISGKISGTFPELSYAQDAIKLGGPLRMRVFDGDVVVRKLRLERAFELVPLLSADIEMVNLDLESLTRTFSFGNIQGRFSGSVDNLRMEDWRPVRFEAHFATPPDDSSRHRISQKAVDSLSSLGGASGTLSRSFLRFFDSFSYDRLGISCRLQNGVCEMGGVEPAGEGYYIVKGGGIPRIDVIGYAREVDWETLLERLKGAMESEGPVVQ